MCSDRRRRYVLWAGQVNLVAAIVHRWPGERDAGRLVDSRMGTKDLFLTRVLIDTARGLPRRAYSEPAGPREVKNPWTGLALRIE